MLLVDVRTKSQAGRKTIGGIAGVEAIDEPKSFLADRHVQSATVDLDRGGGAGVVVDRVDDCTSNRGGGRPLQKSTDGEGNSQLALDPVLQLERSQRIEPQLVQGAARFDRGRLDL